MIRIPESLITMPGIGDHVRPESVITMLRNTHEHLARHKKATIEPDTIKMFKDKFLRVPFDIELGDAAAESGEGDEGTVKH